MIPLAAFAGALVAAALIYAFVWHQLHEGTTRWLTT